MSRIRVVVLLASVVGLVAGHDVWTGHASAQGYRSHELQRTTAIYSPAADMMRDTDIETPRTDVLGNEVDNAVGDYRIDIRGEVYERHSPETEVTKLKPAVG